MKCLKCGMEVKETSTICPFCGSSIEKPKVNNREEELVELPVLKSASKAPVLEEKDNDMLNSLAEKFDKEDVSLEKTRTIKPIEDNNEFSLLNDINKQIETVNEEAKEEIKPAKIETPKEEVLPVNPEVPKEEVKEEVKVAEQKEITSLETKESVNKRTKVLLATALIVVVLVVAIGFAVKALVDSNKNTGNIEERLNQALQTYYGTGKTEDISNLLEEVKDDEDVIDEIHNKVKKQSDEWLKEYYDTEYVSQAEFNSETTRYKELFRGLYEYALFRDDDIYIRALEDDSYNEIVQDMDDNYNTSRVFYEAIDLYNTKDYNKAYYALNQIPSTSIIYNKTRIYVDRINSNVIGLLKNDIAKIEKDIDSLSDSDKLNVYTQIEQIIIDYDRAYNNLELTKNKDYNDILTEYSNKVEEYSN